MATAKSKQRLTVLVQVKISARAGKLLSKKSRRALRSQAGYLRALIYRDLGLTDVEG